MSNRCVDLLTNLGHSFLDFNCDFFDFFFSYFETSIFVSFNFVISFISRKKIDVIIRYDDIVYFRLSSFKFV